jgi:hypothetical protein
MAELYSKSNDFSKIEEPLTLKALEVYSLEPNQSINFYSEYYDMRAFQWEMVDDRFSFTFFVQDETCCFTQYYCVIDEDGNIFSISHLGVCGGDGGWSIVNRGVLTHPGTYHIYERESETDYMSRNDSSFEVELNDNYEYMLRFSDSIFIGGEKFNETKDSTFYLY